MRAHKRGRTVAPQQLDVISSVQRDIMVAMLREEQAKVAAIRRASSRETMEGGHR
jgi:hypothetical protein